MAGFFSWIIGQQAYFKEWEVCSWKETHKLIIFDEGCFPIKFKLSEVKPLFKKRDKETLRTIVLNLSYPVLF